MQNWFSIWTRDHELLSDRVSQEELYRLRGLNDNGRAPYEDREGRPTVGTQLVIPHRRLRGVWLVAAGVDPSAVLAELRRKLSKTVPMAEANRTVHKETFSNEKGAGAYWELNTNTCFNYATTGKSLLEHAQRIAQRNAEKQAA